jgi:hypothetical protein
VPGETAGDAFPVEDYRLDVRWWEGDVRSKRELFNTSGKREVESKRGIRK